MSCCRTTACPNPRQLSASPAPRCAGHVQDGMALCTGMVRRNPLQSLSGSAPAFVRGIGKRAAASHPVSPRSATSPFEGVLLAAAVSAVTPGHRRAVWRPVLRRPRLENRRSVVPASARSGVARPRPHTVIASCALCGRSRNCGTAICSRFSWTDQHAWCGGRYSIHGCPSRP